MATKVISAKTAAEMLAGQRATERAYRMCRLEEMSKRMQRDDGRHSGILTWEMSPGMRTAICIRRPGQEDFILHDEHPADFPSEMLLAQVILLVG